MRKLLQLIVMVFTIFAFEQISAQTIPFYFYGQNAWMPDSIGNVSFNGKLQQNWSSIRDSKARIMRFGGIALDENKPTNHQYIKMIDAMRANGMEPVMQVPFNNGQYTAQQAAAIVQYVNITMGRNVKYWVIGNEPDLHYSYTSAAQVAAYIKPFASAMKAIDPAILTIGPECAWYNQNIINGLTTPNGPSDITGRDPQGRFYIDIISFHFYGFNGTQSRADVISKITAPNQLRDNLVLLNARIASCNTVHGRTGTSALRTAITEANVCYKNSPTDDIYGQGANSFIGGQFLAEMMGTGMKYKVDFINIWSVIEGNNTELNIGYLDRTTAAKKPLYYHFKLLAENINGTYLNGTTNLGNVKSFGSRNGQNTSVLILNQELTLNQNFTVRFNTVAVSGSAPLKINIDGNVNAEYSGNIPAQSSMLLVFNENSQLIRKIEYSLNTHAVAGLPPTVTEFTPTGVPTAVNESGTGTEVVNLKGFQVNLFPNPASSVFTLELDRRNPDQKEFEIEIFDLMGRLIHTSETTFIDRKQKIDLSGSNLAEAVYIVRVREKDDKDNVRANKVVLFK